MRCKCCNVRLEDWEMIKDNDGMCNACIRDSGIEYNIFVDHVYEHFEDQDGVTPPKRSEY